MSSLAEQLAFASVARNDALEFAARTRNNLLFVEDAARCGADVHLVTHLVNSLLGLVVFIRERNFLEDVADRNLAQLTKKGWPVWKFNIGSSKTLGQLMHRLRNSVAHGRIVFSSDDRDLENVLLEVSDYANKEAQQPHWQATISAVDLRNFTVRLIDLLEDTIG